MKYSPRKIYYYFSLVSVLTLIALIFTLITYFGAVSEGRNINLWAVAGSIFIGFYLWGVFYPIIFRITERFGFGERRFFLRNLLLHIGFGFSFSIIHFIIQSTFTWLINPIFQERFPVLLTYLRSSFLGSLYLGLPFYALVVFASQTFLSYRQIAEKEKDAAQLKSELAQAQLKALKMQIQPHFLFNTLNSISSLVLTDPPTAYEMIAKLGDFLRLTLDYNEDQMVLLQEEIRFLRAYLEIEQKRFSDRLQVKFDVEDTVLSVIVPHLVLQPIVENSIKHAMSQRSSGGKIIIKARKIEQLLSIQIEDNGTGNAISSYETNIGSDSGTGLENIRSRLKHHYGENFDFELNKNLDNGMTVNLILPFNFDFENTVNSK